MVAPFPQTSKRAVTVTVAWAWVPDGSIVRCHPRREESNGGSKVMTEPEHSLYPQEVAMARPRAAPHSCVGSLHSQGVTWGEKGTALSHGDESPI